MPEQMNEADPHMLRRRTGTQTKQIATVLLRDYFQHRVFRGVIGEKQWSRFEGRMDRNVDAICAILDRYGARATFFTFGWIAERYPSLIRRIVERGHEIADAGYTARDIADMTPEQFRQDLRRSRAVLEAASGCRVLGYRSYRSLDRSQLRILDILIEEGYRYDASLQPAMFDPLGRSPRTAFEHRTGSGSIVELPMPTLRVLGVNLPIAGGNYIRQFPRWLMFPAYERWIRKAESPFVLYFHPWEIEADQPHVSAIGGLARLRQYRNLGILRELLPEYLSKSGFTSARDCLGLAAEPAESLTQRNPDLSPADRKTPASVVPLEARTAVTVVVPCRNEVDSLPYLKKSLEELERAASDRCDLHFILVDDCSTDRTAELLQEAFGGSGNCRIIVHAENHGVAGAIRTGVEAARTEVVCSMDADCSYDPLELLEMIPLLTPPVSMVTASPYHPKGFVVGVPPWRLFLSRGLSGIYSLILRNRLSTYTSCFRVARRSAVVNQRQTYGDFRGIVEVLARMDMQGAVIREYPTTLQCRVFGSSKMKIVRTILGHVGLLADLLMHQKHESRVPAPASSSIEENVR